MQMSPCITEAVVVYFGLLTDAVVLILINIHLRCQWTTSSADVAQQVITSGEATSDNIASLSCTGDVDVQVIHSIG
jgi:hypothetical protein